VLVIREAQMEALANAVQRSYVKGLANAFTEIYPNRFAGGADQAADFITSNIPKASKFGITSERHVAKFLSFLILHGEDFESRVECAWAVDILKSTEGTGDDRVEWLEARMKNMRLLEEAASSGRKP
jgi:hypothetical protein